MKTKPNTKVKTYIQIWHNIVTDLVLLVKLNEKLNSGLCQ